MIVLECKKHNIKLGFEVDSIKRMGEGEEKTICEKCNKKVRKDDLIAIMLAYEI